MTIGGFNTDTWFDKPSISLAVLCSTTSFSSKFVFEPNFDDPLSIFSLSPSSIFLQMLLRLLSPWFLDMIVLAIYYLGLFSIATWMIVLFISHHLFLSLLCPTFQNELAWNFGQIFKIEDPQYMTTNNFQLLKFLTRTRNVAIEIIDRKSVV